MEAAGSADRQHAPAWFGCAETPCAIAVAGPGLLEIEVRDALNLDVVAGEGPVEVALVTASSEKHTYLATSFRAGTTPVEVVSEHFEPQALVLTTKHVRNLRLLPARRYHTLTENPAFLSSTSDVVLALESDGDHVVDASLTSSLAQMEWDRFQLPPPGKHVVTFTADSIGTRTLAVDVADAFDTVETSFDVPPAIGVETRVCFHAYRFGREVVAPFEMKAGEGVRGHAASNCATVKPAEAGTYTVTATAFSRPYSVDITI